MFHLFIPSRYMAQGNCAWNLHQAIGWSFGLLDLQYVGRQGCQTFSIGQEPGAQFGVSTSQNERKSSTKLTGPAGGRGSFFQMGTW